MKSLSFKIVFGMIGREQSTSISHGFVWVSGKLTGKSSQGLGNSKHILVLSVSAAHGFSTSSLYLGHCKAERNNAASSENELLAARDLESASTELQARNGKDLTLEGNKRNTKKQMSKTKLKKLQKQEQEKERKYLVLQSFSTFYQQQYGNRWFPLMQCLKNEPRSACLINRYAERVTASPVPTAVRVPFLKLPAFESTERFPHPERDSNKVLDYYLLDAASVLVSEALELEGSETVLDLCAAPGGKSFAILQQLALPNGSLTANEPSESRRRRLSKVISDYLPESLRQCVRVMGRDGIRWGQCDFYDKVVVDAPCSSERHLLHDANELGTWRPKRTANCAKRQLALVAAALRSVKVGGTVVYSTCSISYQENDGVISKAYKKLKFSGFEVVHKQWPIGEKTEHGWIVLPDVGDGWGPIYFAVLKKISSGDGEGMDVEEGYDFATESDAEDSELTGEEV